MTRNTPARPFDFESDFPQLREYRGTATRLHPRPGDVGARDSSVGGRMLWPADEPWPTCTAVHPKGTGYLTEHVRRYREILTTAWARDPRSGPTDEERAVLETFGSGNHAPDTADSDSIPLLAVTQLFAREVPGLEPPEEKDLLQIFWCPFEVHDDESRLAVHYVWRNEADVTDVLSDQPEPAVTARRALVPHTCRFDPEVVTEHEYIEKLDETLLESIAACLDPDDGEDTSQYEDEYSLAPGWKVGGFVSWHLTGPTSVLCGCGSETTPLLTITDREWSPGTVSWVPVEDQAVSRDMSASVPTGIYVGRGRLSLLRCAKDRTHPYRFVIQ